MMKKITPKSIGGSEMIGKPTDKMYPRFNIDLAHLPEAERWKVGQTYNVALQIKQTGIHKSKDYGDASFDIVGIEVLKGQKKSKMQVATPPSKRVDRYQAQM